MTILDSQDSSKYGIPNNNNGLSKKFGVYTFEDNQPLFERKARLIERLKAKKDPYKEDEVVESDRSKFKTRSIQGGVGH